MIFNQCGQGKGGGHTSDHEADTDVEKVRRGWVFGWMFHLLRFLIVFPIFLKAKSRKHIPII